MYFKRMSVFYLAEKLAVTEEALSVFKHEKIMPAEMHKLGFVPAFGENFIHEASGHRLFKVQIDNRHIPSWHVRQALEEKSKLLSAEKGRPISRKEKNALKEELIEAMKVSAPVKASFIHAILTKDNWLVIDGSASESETMLALMRKATGSLPALPISAATAEPIDFAITQIVRENKQMEAFTLGYNYAASGQDSMSVKMKNVPRSNDELGSIVSYLDVDSVELDGATGMSFQINHTGFISNIVWSDSLTERSADAEDDAAIFDSNFFIAAETINQTINNLVAVFGGFKQDR